MEYVSIEQLIELSKRFDFLLCLKSDDNDKVIEEKCDVTDYDDITDAFPEIEIPVEWYDLFVNMCEELDKEFKRLEDIGWFKEHNDKRIFYWLYVVIAYQRNPKDEPYKLCYDFDHYVGDDCWKCGDIPDSIRDICEKYVKMSKTKEYKLKDDDYWNYYHAIELDPYMTLREVAKLLNVSVSSIIRKDIGPWRMADVWDY
jgi:hypothetical protein